MALTKKTEKTEKKKPIVKRNSEKKESQNNSDNETESENEIVEVVKEVEAVNEEKPKKVSSKKTMKKEIEKDDYLENDWGAQSDEDFDVADPSTVQTHTHSNVQPNVQTNLQDKTRSKGKFYVEDAGEQDNTEEKGKRDQHQKRPKAAKYNKFGSSPSLNFDHREALKCSDAVNDTSTNKLFEILIARTKEDCQFKLYEVLKLVYRAKNSECEYPVPANFNTHTPYQYGEQEDRSKTFGQSSYKGNVRTSQYPQPSQPNQNFGPNPNFGSNQNFGDRKQRKN